MGWSSEVLNFENALQGQTSVQNAQGHRRDLLGGEMRANVCAMTRRRVCMAASKSPHSFSPHRNSQMNRVARSIKTIVQPSHSCGGLLWCTLVYNSSPSMNCCRNWWHSAYRSNVSLPLASRFNHRLILFLLTRNVRQVALMPILSFRALNTTAMKLSGRRKPAQGVFFVSEK